MIAAIQRLIGMLNMLVIYPNTSNVVQELVPWGTISK